MYSLCDAWTSPTWGFFSKYAQILDLEDESFSHEGSVFKNKFVYF
jgi:hypothetical protein